MDDEMVWKMQLRQVEASIQRLCEEAFAEGRFDRLKELNRSLQDFERAILDAAQVVERGENARTPFWPFLRPLMRCMEEAYSRMAFAWQWDAAEIRMRLKDENQK